MRWLNWRVDICLLLVLLLVVLPFYNAYAALASFSAPLTRVQHRFGALRADQALRCRDHLPPTCLNATCRCTCCRARHACCACGSISPPDPLPGRAPTQWVHGGSTGQRPLPHCRSPSAGRLLPGTRCAERIGSRTAGLGAAALVSALSFLLWHYGRFWPGVPDASEGLFTLRQVGVLHQPGGCRGGPGLMCAPQHECCCGPVQLACQAVTTYCTRCSQGPQAARTARPV